MIFVLLAVIVILPLAVALYSLEESAKKAVQGQADQQSFFEKGKAAYLSGNVDRAERYFTEHLKTNYSHAASYRYLLKIYEDNGKQTNLMQLCQTILELGERNISGVDMGKVRRCLADISYENKSYEDALYHYLLLLKESTSTAIKRRVAYLYASQGCFDKALSYYEAVWQSSPGDNEIKAARIPCLIGVGQESEAIQLLQELKNDGKCSTRELYLFAKLIHEKQSAEESHEIFIDFLKQSKWANNSATVDAMSCLIKDFYISTGFPVIENLGFWLEVFEGFAKLYKDSQQRLLELYWQVGFLSICGGEESYEVARESWMKVFNMDSDYKNIAVLIDKIDEIDAESLPMITKEYMDSRMSYQRFAGEPKAVDPRNFYHIPPIDINAIEKAVESPLMASFTAMFQGKSNGLDDMLSLSENMFELRITQIIRKMGMAVKETVGHNKSNKMSSFRVVNEQDEDLLCCAYQDSRKIGEVELRNVKGAMTNSQLEAAVVISLGSFSSEAAELARKESIRLVSGSELRSMGHVN